MREVIVAAALRTPVGVGKPTKGVFSGTHPADLSAVVLRELLAREDIDPDAVEDVIWGCVAQVGEQSSNIARTAALSAGYPVEVPGVTIDRQCGSSQQALHFGAASVAAGHYDVVVVGGVESMSRVPMRTHLAGGEGPWSPGFRERFAYVNQGISAEMIAERWNLSRAWLDELSVRSHELAWAATRDGTFQPETVPVDTDRGRVQQDQGIRPSTTREALARLRPAFKDDGVITAGNSSQISDGAAALLLTTPDRARQLGLTPLVRVHAVALAGVHPDIKLTGPIPATEKVLRRAALSINDIGVFEVNEAFASVVGAWLKETGADLARVNPRGGAIALGHPLGGSGARIATTLVHEMVREGHRYGLQTMCEGGGMANATIFELVAH
ncbi:acetyl-CoA acetyltransferase [Intrasporangium chromatireducens Q5-1]|uniref:Acetyl-CoA acetyltransferase n=1 Tax=Intrasporangium chromatireducens Q5-1 TaxID=584657 RepID=W9GKG7_9MICO|nr:thiolase family protein [Intrasporangium chromatireducens]EWT05323.1 acetyl-CoA acetyltransferase [Intrasporangium chromatireducens Q5-1]